MVPPDGRGVREGDRHQGVDDAEELRRVLRPAQGGGGEPARRHLVGRHRRSAPAGGGGRADRVVQVAEDGRAPGLGRAPVGRVEGTHHRCLRRRAGVQLQHRPDEEKPGPRAQVLGRSHETCVQGRDPGRQSQFVGHFLHHAGDVRAADGRGQGVRVPEGVAQEHQPVHEIRRGAGARGGRRRDAHRHHIPARRGRAGRSVARRSRSCRRAKAPATRSAA